MAESHLLNNNGVTVRVQAARYDDSRLILTCRGTIAALLAGGYLTIAMVLARSRRKKGKGRPQLDDNGERFFMHPSPTKSAPERVRLVRRISRQFAVQLPWVRELMRENPGDESALSEQTQALVALMLMPFVRGTWKPGAEEMHDV